MKLSVIIVNYNVRHFLEQCLHSVMKAMQGTDAEVFVVDNASVDGSCQMVRSKFPSVRLIENQKNRGYAAANNQAVRESSGEYILLLNPDTVVGEDTFTSVLRFMDEHPDGGGLGVRMIDGKGRFLPESKRGLPTPRVAFYKISGLSALFPKSEKFGKYHLSWLDENKTHPVEVLCGAFMLLRRKTLDQTGHLDESFFMYGEDIDLSYRILLAGYRNYYFAGTTIIHYKGESTKKGSINYVKMFYSAMDIFARKHFTRHHAGFFSLIIQLAIFFRAMAAVLQRLIRRIYIPVADAAVLYGGFALLLPLWERAMFEPGYYPAMYMRWIVPGYILIWLAGIRLSGGYRRTINLYRLIRGLFWGSLAILVAYSLTGEEMRFSRAMIIIGALWAMVMLPLVRILFSKLRINGFELELERQKRIAIVGHLSEAARIRELLGRSPVRPFVAGYVSISPGDEGSDYLGSTGQLKEIIRINRVDEIIFCSEDLSSAEIIRAMLDLTGMDVDYKIAPPESLSIIGSNSIHTAGDLYLLHINAITRTENIRKKRVADFMLAFINLFFFWILVWFLNDKKQALRNAWHVLTGKLSWVGYIPDREHSGDLPPVKKGVLHPGMLFSQDDLSRDQVRNLNILYAKDYSLRNDLELIFKNLKKLDTTPDG